VRGFTLLEVMIALVVLALALLALTRTAAIQTDAFASLRERTLASWLAQNIIAETRLGNPLPSPGRSNGQRRYGGRDWRWELDVSATPAPSIRRLDVRIAAAPAPTSTVVQLSGFTGTDLQR
jgi:general secretion pathway protein I